MTASELASHSFDAASRITTITQQLWASKTVTQTVGTGTATVTQDYKIPQTWQATYDNRNRLTGFTRAGSETRYTYDANSNRLSAIDKTISDTNLNGTFDVPDTALTTSQTLTIQPTSNRLLGFAQTITNVRGTQTLSTTAASVTYSIDANGNLTSDGLRTFEYDESNRLAKVKILKDGEAASIKYLYNALGQQVFKSEPKPEQLLPNQTELGSSFVTWLQTNFGWLYAQAQTDASLGSAYVYADGQLPSWAVLGEYDNGSASGTGRTEYIWLPTEDGSAIPVGMFRNSKFFAIHPDHLGTPRLMTDSTNKVVWQWAYSGFGNNKPIGVLKPTTSATSAFTNQPVLLSAPAAVAVLDLRFPGQMADEETGLFYNTYRSYQPSQGRYPQADPIGLSGGANRFGYVGGNALSFTDPMGLQAIPIPPILMPGVPNPTFDAQRELIDRMRRRGGGDEPEETYQTYTRYHPLTGDCYSGRTSGYGSPEDNVRNRGFDQPLLNSEGFLPPVLDRSSTSYSAVRGREQQLIELNGGARSTGGDSRNAINGISRFNPRGPIYRYQATSEFGTPVPAGKCTCK